MLSYMIIILYHVINNLVLPRYIALGFSWAFHGPILVFSFICSCNIGATLYIRGRWAALPLLGFSPKILGFSKQSWVLGFVSEGLGFFLGFLKGPWVFLGFFKFTRKYIYFCCFLQKVRHFRRKMVKI